MNDESHLPHSASASIPASLRSKESSNMQNSSQPKVAEVLAMSERTYQETKND
jgi:hypothetical protein